MRLRIFALLLCTALSCASLAHAATYEVGVDKPLQSLGAVPWESLKPGDVVRVFYRAEPYREKLVLAVSGTESAPIRIEGVPGPNGERPIIDGENATTRAQLNYWGDTRSVVKIGGASVPNAELGRHIVLQGLTIRGGRSPRTYTAASGAVRAYDANAAALFIERGENIVVRDCGLYDSGNGLFVANESRDISIVQSDISGNGNPNSIYEHNVYSEALGILFEGNNLGPLCSTCPGNNLKDRSAGTVIRYNWIEGGNRQLDLVESSSATLRNDPRYAETYVYGNVLIEREDAGNRQIVHWGGDGGTVSTYRRGTLFMYANTIVSNRAGRTSLLRNSSAQGQAQIYGNLVHCTAGAGQLEILADALGTAQLRKNWLTNGWVASFANGALVDSDPSNLTGLDPRFVSKSDYALAMDSPAVNAGGFPMVAVQYAPTAQAAKPRMLEGRPVDALPDVGAIERGVPLAIDAGAPLSDGGTNTDASAGGDAPDASTGGGGSGGGLPPAPPGEGGSMGVPEAGDGQDEGCSCRVASARGELMGWAAFALLSLWLQRRRAWGRRTLG